jgi:hypothetical protein
VLRRSSWDEIELDGAPDAMLMCHDGWVTDYDLRETLALSIRETGWFPRSAQSFDAAANADIRYGWIGVTDQSTLAICNEVGLAVSTGENLIEVRPVTLARISNPD